MARTRATAVLLIFGLAMASLLPAPVPAQQADAPVITPYDVEQNAAYNRTVMLRRIQSEVVYVDQLTGELPLDGVTLPEPPPVDPTQNEARSTFSQIILAVVLIALLVLLYANRNFILRLLGREGEVAKPAAKPTKSAPQPTPAESGLLGRLARAQDREAALVELLEAALGAAARANGLRLGRAETAREFLRRLPRDWPHAGALHTIVMTEELVQFGGRPLTTDAFETCLATARPIIMERRRA